ncbi:MAG: aminoacyl-tRNA hydrolase [Alphaproteobacteria bacterium]|nr:aminoacyl-tRNA hydrolase [Alphaproteobacteria bacterium]MBV8548522.1 aminoacyl-tRNA hydrolase [Alphaproteobacteria bacterium]
MPAFTHLIVGLGNPGPEYANTRHNIGFMVLDELAARYRVMGWKRQFKAQTAAVVTPPLMLMKPETYMNLSGEAVGEALRFHKLSPDQVIVFHDELDLPPGQVRVKQGGGAAGHNGLKSLDAHIGKDYWRVRIGIGHPGVKGDGVSNYVLSSFAKADQAWQGPLVDALVTSFESLLEGRVNDYVARVTRAVPQPIVAKDQNQKE